MTDFAFLKGKTVFVVGGASGLGASVANCAVQAGAKVVVFDIARSDIGHYRFVDLRDAASIGDTLAKTQERFDILINSAGLPAGADAASILQVNYLGQMRFLDGILARANDGAKVITIASIAGREWRAHGKIITLLQAVSDLNDAPEFCAQHGVDDKAAYRLSKAALIHKTRQMSTAHPDNDVTFLTVSPGPVNTELFKRAAANSPDAAGDMLSAAPRVPDPQEIAQAILGLCRPEFGWLNGIDIPLDGGADARLDAKGVNLDIDFKSMAKEQ